MQETIVMQARFCLSIQTNPNWEQDVPVDRGQCLMQQPLRSSDL
jgi:hypothetical protein